jgi:hypothetical protein
MITGIIELLNCAERYVLVYILKNNLCGFFQSLFNNLKFNSMTREQAAAAKYKLPELRRTIKDRIKVLKEEHPEATMDQIFDILSIEDLV